MPKKHPRLAFWLTVVTAAIGSGLAARLDNPRLMTFKLKHYPVVTVPFIRADNIAFRGDNVP
jgi:hypothetical protein